MYEQVRCGSRSVSLRIVIRRIFRIRRRTSISLRLVFTAGWPSTFHGWSVDVDTPTKSKRTVNQRTQCYIFASGSDTFVLLEHGDKIHVDYLRHRRSCDWVGVFLSVCLFVCLFVGWIIQIFRILMQFYARGEVAPSKATSLRRGAKSCNFPTDSWRFPTGDMDVHTDKIPVFLTRSPPNGKTEKDEREKEEEQ